MKKIVPAYILSFIISFMFFTIEPLSVYVNNTNDFSFNIQSFIGPLIITFFICFAFLSLIYTIIFYIDKKFFKKNHFFNIVIIISYILFIMLYIQGNFMSSRLPGLDGTEINWSLYKIENIIFITLFIVLIILYLFFVKKFQFEKVIKISEYISLAIFVMLLSGFIPTLFNKKLYKNERITYVSLENIDSISKNQNFLIFLLDAVSSRTFHDFLESSEYKEEFNDFTYFPNTLSTFQYTRDSIPQILSGVTNYNEKDFAEYYNDSMDNSSLINSLKEKDYMINLYDLDNKWNTDKSKVVNNIKRYNGTFSNKCYAKQETKYILFRYLPYFLKRFSKIETFSLNSCKFKNNVSSFILNDSEYYKMITSMTLKPIDDNYFSFIHLEGAHVPFDIDEDFKKVNNGTYEQKVMASIKMTGEYLKLLKKCNAYDNSVIIILADHGYWAENTNRFNPILYIKGIDEHHPLYTSNKPLTFEDLGNAYLDLLNNKKSDELFSNITDSRTRKVLYTDALYGDHMVEYEVLGDAWDSSKFQKTGKEYNR